MPRPIIMLSSVNGFVKRAVTATTTCYNTDVVLTADDQQCGKCERRDITAEEEEVQATSVPESSSTPPALESQDVISAIASQISDNKTLAALSRIDKTAHDATAPNLALERQRYAEGEEALKDVKGRLNGRYHRGRLYLNDKKLSERDVAEIVDLLKHNSVLTDLNLNDCGLDAEGGIAIAAALNGNKALIDLSLSGNNINVRGAKAFAAALEVNRTLTRLDLSNNTLCGKAKWMIYSSVPHTKDMSGVEALCNVAEKASWPDGALKTLKLDDNFLGELGERLLRKAMDKPAVVAERRRRAQELEDMWEARRLACLESRRRNGWDSCGDTSCPLCDHGGC